jgi:hypothetical protein
VRVFNLSIVIFLIAALPVGSPAADDDVAQTIRTFYKWYVPHLEKGEKAKSDHQMSDFATARLLARIKQLSKSEKDDVPALDYDPFLNAQDYSADWATRVAVRNVKLSGDKATATVVLGGGEERSTVHLILIRTDGRWKIDNFVPKL